MPVQGERARKESQIINPHADGHEKASVTPQGERDTAYAGGTGSGTGGQYDEKRDPPYPESSPTYVGHAAIDFDASKQGGDASVPVTDSGVSNADVDEFTTSGNSLGQNAGASRDEAPSVSKSIHDSGRRTDDA